MMEHDLFMSWDTAGHSLSKERKKKGKEMKVKMTKKDRAGCHLGYTFQRMLDSAI